jgi:hypothetical protein
MSLTMMSRLNRLLLVLVLLLLAACTSGSEPPAANAPTDAPVPQGASGSPEQEPDGTPTPLVAASPTAIDVPLNSTVVTLTPEQPSAVPTLPVDVVTATIVVGSPLPVGTSPALVEQTLDGVEVSLLRVKDDETAPTERTYRAILVNRRSEPLALRAFICPAQDEPFTPQAAELLAGPDDAGGLVVLQEDGCTRVQGVLWNTGDEFIWQVSGQVAPETQAPWITEVVIYASYRTSEERNEWEPLALPILEHRDQLAP